MSEATTIGTIEAIHIAPSRGEPMQAITRCMAICGHGLEGDRYAIGKGSFSKQPLDHELTLIEAETLDAIAHLGFRLSAGESRRNITTRDIGLNALVGVDFSIGAVRCRGTRLCDPCSYLQRHLKMPGLLDCLKNRGGLRAKILTGGEIEIGAVVSAG